MTSLGVVIVGARIKHPLYKTWAHMRYRCHNPKNSNYRDYGARGISVCKRWHKFENFIEDMGVRPSGTTLDRIDNNKGYFPKNCRWATPKEQSRNNRLNHRITFNGRTMILQDWADEYGIRRDILSQRLRYGWSVERAITIPPQHYKRRGIPMGATMAQGKNDNFHAEDQ